MLAWKTDLFLYYDGGVIRVENVSIRRGIFQGDALSPLLFILAINPLSLFINRRCKGYCLNKLNVSHVLYMDDLKGVSSSFQSLKKMATLIENFSTDIGMELGLSKCKVINLVGGRYAMLGDIVLESGGVIKELNEDETYKYLGVQELDGIKHQLMKEKTLKDAKSKLRKLLETELNGKNLIVAINECVLPVVTYSFGILNWLESELKGFDVQVRKLLNIYQMFSLHSDVDRLYTSRKLGGRGLISVWDAFKSSICRVAHMMRNLESEILAACCAVDQKSLFSNLKRADKYESEVNFELQPTFWEKPVLLQAKMKASCIRACLVENHLTAWKLKPQHGAFLRKLETLAGVDIKASMSWLSSCHLAPYSESYGGFHI